ncbi:MAG: HPr family phosphocarrier protein [Acidobacteriota bacterium]|nr:HPr family phosphocarrier protein [Acidobacteriota bacterium]
MVNREVSIVNALGLHARAAARFVHTASAFSSHIRVTRGARTMDGKSILGLLLLSAGRGTTIEISAEGPDEQEAVEALAALAARGFEAP